MSPSFHGLRDIKLYLMRYSLAKVRYLGWGSKQLVKNNQDNLIQSITLCNMYFSQKSIHSIQPVRLLLT